MLYSLCMLTLKLGAYIFYFNVGCKHKILKQLCFPKWTLHLRLFSFLYSCFLFQLKFMRTMSLQIITKLNIQMLNHRRQLSANVPTNTHYAICIYRSVALFLMSIRCDVTEALSLCSPMNWIQMLCFDYSLYASVNNSMFAKV